MILQWLFQGFTCFYLPFEHKQTGDIVIFGPYFLFLKDILSFFPPTCVALTYYLNFPNFLATWCLSVASPVCIPLRLSLHLYCMEFLWILKFAWMFRLIGNSKLPCATVMNWWPVKGVFAAFARHAHDRHMQTPRTPLDTDEWINGDNHFDIWNHVNHQAGKSE